MSLQALLKDYLTRSGTGQHLPVLCEVLGGQAVVVVRKANQHVQEARLPLQQSKHMEDIFPQNDELKRLRELPLLVQVFLVGGVSPEDEEPAGAYGCSLLRNEGDGDVVHGVVV